MAPVLESTVAPIGYMQTCFPEKFGTPRQPGLVPEATGTIRLIPPYDASEMVRGLETYSHIWVIFRFHASADAGWRSTVRPPRLGGNRRMGVLATRSGFRPNAIGMSALRLTGIRCGPEGVFIEVSGVDVIDGTPVLDIKPYLPYSDRIADAVAPQAPSPPDPVSVAFSPGAEADLAALSSDGYPCLRDMVAAVLALDPRPAYDAGRSREKTYGMRVYDLNIRWAPAPDGIRVSSISRTAAEAPSEPGRKS